MGLQQQYAVGRDAQSALDESGGDGSGEEQRLGSRGRREGAGRESAVVVGVEVRECPQGGSEGIVRQQVEGVDQHRREGDAAVGRHLLRPRGVLPAHPSAALGWAVEAEEEEEEAGACWSLAGEFIWLRTSSGRCWRKRRGPRGEASRMASPCAA